MAWWPMIMPSHREVIAAHLLECLPASIDDSDGQIEATDALLTLAARGQVPAADFGFAQLVAIDVVKLNRVTSGLAEAVLGGAHAEVWSIMEIALPALLPGPGQKARAELADLVGVAARAASLAAAHVDLPRLAAVAARGGSSKFVQEASPPARPSHRTADVVRGDRPPKG